VAGSIIETYGHMTSPKRKRIARKLILASRSPRRRELLVEAGYEFDVVVPSEQAECGVCSGETPPELVARLAFQKAADVAGRGLSGIVVGCDTMVACHGQVLGKPRDEAGARHMLELQSGREQQVYSGLCAWPVPEGEPLVRVARTTLRMDRLDSGQIAEYLGSGQWEDKAGAFGYQDRLGWVHVVEGSESNVVGLPLEMLAEMLDELAARDPGRR